MGIHYNSINTFTVYKKMNLFDDPTISYPEAFAWEGTISLSLSAAVSDDNAERLLIVSSQFFIIFLEHDKNTYSDFSFIC